MASKKMQRSYTNRLAAHHPSNYFVRLIRSVRKGVVAIQTEDTPTTTHRFGIMMEQPRHQQQQPERQFGSGFIISRKGYILTNYHVIQNARRIYIKLDGIRSPVTAQVVWSEPKKDLAVLQIKTSHPLHALKLGDSTQTQVGEWVLAVGNPFGLDQTATTGIISGKNRPLQLSNRYYHSVIQTDAPINPGNSGGPLINLHGHVIGVNTLIIYPSQCLGFAIPTENIKPLIKRYVTA
ncbi:Trypsin-like peptidase domain-containing protein [Thermoactinomyces sp. DSM 45891]|uniref:S1C family serine protease n=1 Tax=Thermoactinomyces sp. DSM 45891 TaxID=1761907 RepID=UPI00091296CD|nr:trypsin-like peptidase domain-containing protein [Thermoactinomyces sp. DSM 45891]SFX44135.1 Trypsin-like peptidase domain-containing protein [Thermoactinomyces sp. DSM 45891]